MQLIGIQILALLFALFMFYLSFLHYKKNELTTLGFLFWVLIWLVFVTFTIFPQLLNPIIGPLKVVRALDLLMLGAFVILTVLSFENQIKNRKIEKKIEELTRKEALKKIAKK